MKQTYNDDNRKNELRRFYVYSIKT